MIRSKINLHEIKQFWTAINKRQNAQIFSYGYIQIKEKNKRDEEGEA